MTQEEWIKKHVGQAPTLPDEVLARALGHFGVKIKKS
jgi:hypothetical protein